MSDDTVIALKGIYRAHGDENHYGRVARQSLEMILALQAEVERLTERLDYVDYGWRSRQGFKTCYRCLKRNATYFESRNGNLCGKCRAEMLKMRDHFDESDFMKIREQAEGQEGEQR
jgi:hypothetical protein